MSEAIKRYFRMTSWPILLAMLSLIAVGVTAIGVSERADSVPVGFMNRQIAYGCAALVVFVVVTLIPYTRFGRAAYVLFGLTVALLVLVLFLPPIRGSHRWIDLKIFMAQPSELAKLTFVILLAWYLRTGDNYRHWWGLIVPFVLTFIPMALILKEPDLGTSLLLPPTLYTMLFMAGAKWRHLLGIVGVGTLLVFLPLPRPVPAPPANMGFEQKREYQAELETRHALAYWGYHHEGREYLVSAAPLALMKRHQIERIDGWLRQGDPDVLQSKAYQLHQSKMILGAGGWSGRGEWNDTDTYFQMLPDDHTDFIFSVIGGQWGFRGCLALLVLYAVIFVFGIEIAAGTNDAFGRLLAIGVLALLFTQLVINIGMTMGLMPITGMTLPLVSYGGSSLLVNCAAIGLLVNVGQRRPMSLGRRPFEYGRKKEKPPAPYGPLAEKGKDRPITPADRHRPAPDRDAPASPQPPSAT